MTREMSVQQHTLGQFQKHQPFSLELLFCCVSLWKLKRLSESEGKLEHGIGRAGKGIALNEGQHRLS